MRYWILTLFISCFFSVFSQNETFTTEVINGKKYYVHFVQAGNTLWGIHSIYDVAVEEIVRANPGTEKGINEGQKIIIPVPLETVLHEVENKETLFAISKKYGVTIESIILANPGIENGLNTGQKIKILGVERDLLKQSNEITSTESLDQKADTNYVKKNEIKISFTDTVINHIVLDHETLYSISKRYMLSLDELQSFNKLKSSKIKPGDTIKIPIKKEKIELVKIRQVEEIEVRKVDSTLLFPKKSKYKVAILLPFYLDKGENYSDNVSTLATEFYMGAKLAIDSLERIGLKAEVYVFDSKMDTLSIKKILTKPEFQGMDLVIGPLFPDNVDVVARWCKANNARMVCPVVVSPSVLKNNPFVYSAVPSDATLIKGLAEYTLRTNSLDQIILIKSSNEKDLIMYESYRNTFLFSPVKGTRPKLIEATLENYSSFMKKGVKVILVFPSNEKLLTIKFMNSLSLVAQKFETENIFIYGTKEWLNFDDIKPHYRNKYNFHFSSPNDLNYKYEQTEKLHLKYRSAYNSDMTKMAVQGFDVVFYFCSSLLMNKTNSEMVMNVFEMKQLGLENGFENSNYFILEQEDYELINVERN